MHNIMQMRGHRGRCQFLLSNIVFDCFFVDTVLFQLAHMLNLGYYHVMTLSQGSPQNTSPTLLRHHH